MSRLPRLTGSEIIAALGKAGFAVARIKGSHHRLRHSDGRVSTVPVHGSEIIGPGLLSTTLRQLQALEVGRLRTACAERRQRQKIPAGPDRRGEVQREGDLALPRPSAV